jgi:hypothetical protein
VPLSCLPVLDLVEVLPLVTYLVGIVQERAHEFTLQRLERDDILAASPLVAELWAIPAYVLFVA